MYFDWSLFLLSILYCKFGRHLFWNLNKYLGRKFFCKFYLILFPLCILLLCFRRNIFWNAYQYWEENSSENCTWLCYHYVSCFWFWEEIYSEMCTNILEEISSESFIWHCYYRVTYFFIEEEIYSEICSKYLGRKFVWYFYLIFLPLCIILWCLGRNLFWNVYRIFGKKILLKVLLDIVAIKHPNFTFLKKFIQQLFQYSSKNCTWYC